MSEKEVVAKETTEVVSEELMAMMTVEEGQEEHLSKDEMQIPMLKIAQKGSPQVDDGMPEYIDGLKAGMFFNSSTGSIFGESIKIQALSYFRNFVIWEGEKGKGVYKGTMTVDEFEAYAKVKGLIQEGGSFVEAGAGEDGADLRYTDTRNYAVILPDYTEEGLLVFALSSTGIKPSKEWNSKNGIRMLNGKRAKRHTTIWELKTGSFQKDTYSWKQINKIVPLRFTNAEEFSHGEAFLEFAKTLKDSEVVKYSEDSNSTVETPKESDF